jgi:hypothetical protein
MRKRNPNDYKPPAKARQGSRDGRYISFQTTPRLNEVTHALTIPGRCDTEMGGKRIWLRGKRPDKSKYMFPIIVDGERCTNLAATTKRVNGKTVRYCRKHIGIEWDEFPDQPDA